MTATSTLSSSARRALRAAAHHLDPVVMMGQHGLTPAVLHEIDLALTAHALIKVRAGSDERETREGYLAEICQKLGCESVQHLGKLFVLWRNADGGADDDQSAEQDAATLKAGRSRKAVVESTTDSAAVRGPRSKLASERAAGAAARAGAGAAAPRTSASGERRRWGDAPPEQPRREGWAPKDRRGAARFGTTEGGDDTRRRDGTGTSGYAAPRARAPAGGAGGGYGGGAARGTGGPPSGRSGYGSNERSGSGDGGGSGDARGQGYGGRSSYGQGGQAGNAAPRARWGERREPPQGGGYGGGAGEGNTGRGGGPFGDDRGRSGFGDNTAPKQRAAYGRNSDAAGAGRPPRTGGGYAGGGSTAPAGGRGGWGSRDGVTGKPSGYSRGGTGSGSGAGTAGSAKPRTRRRLG